LNQRIRVNQKKMKAWQQKENNPQSFQTTDPDTELEYTLTFDAQGTATPSGPQGAKITNGTIQEHIPYKNPDGSGPPQTLTGNITSGYYITTRSPNGIQFYATIQNTDFLVESACNASGENPIEVNPGYSSGGIFSGGIFRGAVLCPLSQSGGGDTTAQPSSPMTGTTTSLGGDRDGIPDSSDKCTHNSNPRCFKEGEASTTKTTTTTQQEQPSSSSIAGNQTR
jgi:hypothetical protein